MCVLTKELMVTTHVMQSSLNELSTLVADSVKCKQMKVDTYVLNSQTNVELYDGLWVCHQPDIKLGGFRSQLGVFSVSHYTE